MKIIDTKGHKCPQPLIMLKEGLQEMNAGEKVRIYTDNETSLKNLVSYLKDQGVEAESTQIGEVETWDRRILEAAKERRYVE